MKIKYIIQSTSTQVELNSNFMFGKIIDKIFPTIISFSDLCINRIFLSRKHIVETVIKINLVTGKQNVFNLPFNKTKFLTCFFSFKTLISIT